MYFSVRRQLYCIAMLKLPREPSYSHVFMEALSPSENGSGKKVGDGAHLPGKGSVRNSGSDL